MTNILHNWLTSLQWKSNFHFFEALKFQNPIMKIISDPHYNWVLFWENIFYRLIGGLMSRESEI